MLNLEIIKEDIASKQFSSWEFHLKALIAEVEMLRGKDTRQRFEQRKCGNCFLEFMVPIKRKQKNCGICGGETKDITNE